MSSTLLAPPERTETVTDRDTGHDESVSQIVGFNLGDETYGLSIMNVQEIILPGTITPMPSVPPYVLGLTNLRGDVIPVVDLSLRFGLDLRPKTDSSRIVVLNVGEQTIGIVVDAVDEVLRIRDSQIEPISRTFSGPSRAYVSGLVKLEDRLVIMLRADQILNEEQAEAPS